MDQPLLEFWDGQSDEEGEETLSKQSLQEDHSLSPSSLSPIRHRSDEEEGNGDSQNPEIHGPLMSSLNRTISQLLPELELEEPQLSSRSVAFSRLRWFREQLHMLWESPMCGKGSSIKQISLSMLVVITGVSHVVLFKLQTIPMYNYPTFLSVYSSFVYMLAYFGFLIAASLYSCFSRTHSDNAPQMRSSGELSLQTRANWKMVLTISFLSALGSLLQIVAVCHVPGTLLVVLLQSATPILVALHFWSRRRGERIASYSQFGALVITFGVIFLLMFSGTTTRHKSHTWWPWEWGKHHDVKGNETESRGTHGGKNGNMTLFDDDEYALDDDLDNHGGIHPDHAITSDLVWTWAVLLVLSCLLLTFSAHIYRWASFPRSALASSLSLSSASSRGHLSLIATNVLLATMHLLWGTLLSIPIAMITFLPSYQWDLQNHWRDSVQCLFLSINSVDSDDENQLVHADNCSYAALWVHSAILASMLHAGSLFVMVRYGSLKLLSSAVMITIIVAYAVFSVLQAATGMPSSSDPWLDLLGLLVILIGVGFYRFGSASMTRRNEDNAHLAHGVLHSGVYFVDLHDDGGDSDNSNDGETTSFLEFLREPFLLQGDV